jgi:putative addiction module component (TIGR02574 family)
MDLNAVLHEVACWPLEDRIKLMQELWDGVVADGYETELTAAQRAELERRIAEDDAAPDDVVAWEDVKARALTRIQE